MFKKGIQKNSLQNFYFSKPGFLKKKNKNIFRYTLVNFVTELHTNFVKHFRAILLHKCTSGILFD
jgi:hypothetical protein